MRSPSGPDSTRGKGLIPRICEQNISDTAAIKVSVFAACLRRRRKGTDILLDTFRGHATS